MSRSDLTIIVITFDLLVCVTFVVLSALMMSWIDDEATINDVEYVQITDFSVRIKNLPPVSVYKNLEQLKAMLIA